jgi:hypothetical protein
MLTKQIPKLERERAALSAALDETAGDYERTVEVADELATAIETLDTSETRWLELTEKSEQLKS